MKNVFLIPTDKPSRLSILNSGKLNLGAEAMSSSNSKLQHTYITFDEEIKEGDWCIDKHNVVYKQETDKIFTKFNGAKKIILTTDTELIKTGVQAIDDEFLEWFVKNPSCEWVEVESMINMIQFTPREFIYKIIIPQEEPKQETFEEALVYELEFTHDANRNLDFDLGFKTGGIIGAKWQAERMYSEEEVLNILQEFKRYLSFGDEISQSDWFEQFKKK